MNIRYTHIYTYVCIHIFVEEREGLFRVHEGRTVYGVCLCSYIHMYVCMYIYIYIYIHTYHNDTGKYAYHITVTAVMLKTRVWQ